MAWSDAARAAALEARRRHKVAQVIRAEKAYWNATSMRGDFKEINRTVRATLPDAMKLHAKLRLKKAQTIKFYRKTGRALQAAGGLLGIPKGAKYLNQYVKNRVKSSW